MNLQKGFQNIFCLNPINIVIIAILLIILVLVYIKTNKFELFGSGTTTSTTIPSTTIPSTTLRPISQVIGNSPLINFINNYIKKVNQQSKFSSILINREPRINSLSKTVSNLINPST
jgi:hypothetical protein